MANIQGYLQGLEARLAASLDAQSLQERLTEAENHLRDRAQEFEEIGLPPLEAEARAVAAFGAPEEYAVELPPRPAPAPPKALTEAPKRDIALQLAWSAMGLGLVSMLAVAYGGALAGGAAAFFLFLGALFGRATALSRLALLSAVSALALFPVLVSSYIPTPIDGGHGGEGIGFRLPNARSWQDYEHQDALESLRTFERYRQMVLGGRVPTSPEGKAIGPNPAERYAGPRFYGYGGSSLGEYDSPAKARSMWLQEGDTLRERLQDDVSDTTPQVLALTRFERTIRFAAISVAGGVLLMALLTGAQGLGMALRTFFGWLFRRRPMVQPMMGRWESPRQ